MNANRHWLLSAALKHWPLFVALLVFAALFILVFSSAARYTSGQLVYALDDPYIHMSIARSLAEHGVWGLDGAHFAGASSSLLWPLLLAILFLVQGANDFSPLVLNVLAALGLLTISHAFLARRGVRSPVIFLVLLLLIVATPLIPLSLTGMEHVLHAFLAVAFAVLLSAVVAAPADRRWPPLMLLAALFLGAIRYEGLCEAGLAALGLFAYRRRGLALLILAVAVLPAAIYAALSLANGWHALPNSVLLKASQPSAYSPGALTGYFLGRVDRAWFNAAVLGPTAAVLGVLAMGRRLRPEASAAAWLFVGTALAHIALASYGAFFRYEAYLVALGLVSLGALASPTQRIDTGAPLRWPAVWVLLGLCACPLVERAINSHNMTPLGVKNVADQHIQMARFLAKSYPGRSVAANDIGAVSYYGGVRLLDLWGLADLAVADQKLRGTFDTDAIRKITAEHEVEVAVVYNDWFAATAGGLPSEWVEAARWKIIPRVVAGSDVVSFYATSTTGAIELTAALKEFQRQLPVDIQVKYGPL